jgi:hypothetical protein
VPLLSFFKVFRLLQGLLLIHELEQLFGQLFLL